MRAHRTPFSSGMLAPAAGASRATYRRPRDDNVSPSAVTSAPGRAPSLLALELIADWAWVASRIMRGGYLQRHSAMPSPQATSSLSRFAASRLCLLVSLLVLTASSF